MQIPDNCPKCGKSFQIREGRPTIPVTTSSYGSLNLVSCSECANSLYEEIKTKVDADRKTQAETLRKSLASPKPLDQMTREDILRHIHDKMGLKIPLSPAEEKWLTNDPGSRIRPVQECFVNMFAATRGSRGPTTGVGPSSQAQETPDIGANPLAAVMLPVEWKALKDMFDPKKGLESWRHLVPKDILGIPSLEPRIDGQDPYIVRVRHIMLQIRKDADDKRAEQLARDVVAREEKRMASTAYRLEECGCYINKTTAMDRLVSNIQKAIEKGADPKFGWFVSCIPHDTRDYKLGKRLMGIP